MNQNFVSPFDLDIQDEDGYVIVGGSLGKKHQPILVETGTITDENMCTKVTTGTDPVIDGTPFQDSVDLNNKYSSQDQKNQ